MKYKIIVFDLDQTLIDGTIYKDVIDILDRLKKSGYLLSIASFNRCARILCDRYDITKYFDIICGYSDFDKISHFNTIVQYYKFRQVDFKHEEIIFFDDQYMNFVLLKPVFNVKCYLINPDVGLTLKDVEWL